LVLGRGFRQIQDGGCVAILKNSNGDISTADHPIYSMFGSRMGVFGVGGSNGAISGFAKSKMAGMWEKTMREE